MFYPSFRALLHGVFAMLFLLCFAFPNFASSATLNSAIDKYKFGDFRSAIKQWEQLARMGNPDALFNLGQVYRMGNGVDIDMAKVEYFYRRAAQSGHMEAQNNLASLYFFDEKDTTRRGEALTWWRLAARHGHGQSQYMLAVLHYNGEHLPKDNIQAFAWVVLAREAGVEAALVAERVMRRTLSVNEMTQGRLLSRGLLETPLDTSGYNVTIPNLTEAINQFPLYQTPPLVVDAPQTPPTPSSATMTSNQPSSPPVPKLPPSPPVLSAEQQVVQTTPQTTGRFSNWSLQLGSFRSVDNPNALYARLRQEQPVLMQGLSSQIAEADLGQKGIFYRLLIGPFQNKDEALEHCQKLKNAGYDCIAIAP